MRPDVYTRVLLTIIALCLVIFTFRSVPFIREANADTPLSCTGELKANAFGGVEPSIGGYAISLKCR